MRILSSNAQTNRESGDATQLETRKRTLDAAAGLGALLCAVLTPAIFYPFAYRGDTPGEPLGGSTTIVCFVVTLILAGVLLGSVADWLTKKDLSTARSVFLLVALLPGLLLAHWFLNIRQPHDSQRAGFETFSRYFERIPPGQLGDPFVIAQGSSDPERLTICADVGEQSKSNVVCAHIDEGLPRGSEVTGGYKGKYGPFSPEEFADAHDCWGSALECES